MDSQSWKDLDDLDVVLDFGLVERCAVMSVGYDKNKLNCPLHSPLHNDHRIKKLPNVFVLGSRHEALFNDSQLLVKKLKEDCDDNCNVIHEIEEYTPHISPVFIGLFPEAKISFDKVVNAINDWNIK